MEILTYWLVRVGALTTPERFMEPLDAQDRSHDETTYSGSSC